MFGFGKKRKPETGLDLVIKAIYGDPSPPKRANVSEAAGLASEELLMEKIDASEVKLCAEELAAGRIPYSTHDLALCVALHFFKRPQCIEPLRDSQLIARMMMNKWLQEGFVAPMIAKSFEDTLYALYKS